ncbi:MAG: 1-acyl-sn-glycerol-3-phosphate acyltransferase [Lachnospiraceae bacterium]|nr:1-acyl-sn-glycerol-3-phosphate acyltransferase [Lachnospiraceae bacterium]
MIRLLFAAIYLILFLVLTIPLMLITWLIGRFHPHAGDVSSLAIVNWGFRCLWVICGIRPTVIGAERVPTDTSVLYAANHRSIFDIVVTYPLVNRPTGFIAKKEMLKAPLLNIWMMLLHCLFLDRKNPRAGLNVILKAIELEQKGISVFVFPEGTRNKDHESTELLPMHNGSFKIATKTGVPIIPVTICGTKNIMSGKVPGIRKSKIVVEFGEPIYVGELSKEEAKNVSDMLAARITETYVRNLPMT